MSITYTQTALSEIATAFTQAVQSSVYGTALAGDVADLRLRNLMMTDRNDLFDDGVAIQELFEVAAIENAEAYAYAAAKNSLFAEVKVLVPDYAEKWRIEAELTRRKAHYFARCFT